MPVGRLHRPILWSHTGLSQFVEFTGDDQFKTKLKAALGAGAMPLGILTFRFEDQQLQAGRVILPWLEKEADVVAAFDEICDEAVEKVRGEADRWNRPS